ncbi:hypothetical protein BH92_28015 (plasmid) [Rhodococcoides fascians A21d2]|jgi:hypothetical protein|uniref:hypothetical protein n=1 Tax=Rhodococcoides fascians TaxID=1828 RepID=UPI000A4303A4|nr:hypothetical protein [Rhodococcus fascians]QII03910.1 hypothetical protein BH92_28015 [Rhodococcus fascians A21d2]
MREQIIYPDQVGYVGPLPSLFDLSAVAVINTVATLLISIIVLLWSFRRHWAKPAAVVLTLAVLTGAAIAGHSIVTPHTALAAIAYLMPVFALGVAGLLHVFVHHRPPSASNNQKGDPMTATTIQDAVDGKAL